VHVGGKRVDRPGYAVSAGEVITLGEKAAKNAHVVAALGDPPLERPQWLERDEASGALTVTATPSADSVPLFIDVQLVVEHYAQSLRGLGVERDMILSVSHLGTVMRRSNGAIVIHVAGHTLHVDSEALNAIAAMLEEAVHTVDTHALGGEEEAEAH
jgi:hypothetical protein